MQLKKWLKYTGVLTLILVLGIVLVWNFSPLKPTLRHRIVQRLNQELHTSFFLKDFTIGWNTLTFRQIEIVPPRKRFRILMEGIQLQWSWLRFFSHRHHPLEVVDKITLIQPRVIFQSKPTDSTSQKGSSLDLARILRQFQQLPQIETIHIRDGAIFWQSGNGHPVAILHQLSGYLHHLDSLQFQLHLQARLPKENLPSIQLVSLVHTGTQRLSGMMTFTNCQLERSLPFLQHKFFRVEHALLNGKINFTMPHYQPDSLLVFGKLVLEHNKGFVFNQEVEAPHIEFTFQGSGMTIEPFRGTVEGAPATFRGRLMTISHPQADWWMEVWDYPADHLKKSHSIFDLVKNGRIHGIGHFSGPLRQMKIEAWLDAPDILYAIVPFTHNRLHLTYAQKQLILNRFRADFRQLKNVGTGIVDFTTDWLKLAIHSTLAIPPETFQFLDRLNASMFSINTQLAGNFLAKDFHGSWQYTLQDSQGTTLQGQGPLHLKNQFLRLQAASTMAEDSLTIQAQIAQLFSDPFIHILDIRNFPLEKLTTNRILHNLASNYATHLYMSGPYHFLTTKFKWNDRYTGDPVFAFQGNLKNVFKEHQRFFGQFQANTSPLPLQGNLQLSITAKGLEASISAPRLVEGHILLGKLASDPFVGELTIHPFQIADYISNTTYLSRLLRQGTLQGAIYFQGTVAHPEVRFRFQADEFIINDVGYYATQVKGHLENHRWISEDFEIRLNNVPICVARGYWDVRSDSLSLSLRGSDIESNFLVETLFHDRSLMQGIFSYDFYITGTLAHPTIYGNVDVRNGKVLDNPFDLISISFLDSVKQQGDLWEGKDHRLHIQKLLYVNRQEYTIEGKGELGLSETSPIDIQLEVTGNILAELPKLQPYFQEPVSNGQLFLHIVGSRSHPTLNAARLHITNGSLAFASVLPPLHNLHADIELEPEGHRVMIHEISGTFNGRWARLSNTFQAKVAGKELLPWYFEDLGLNFGILVLETDKQGIPLSIPGMMMKGDIGYFAATGKTPEEKFYFAGPVTAPTVRGKVVLYNCRVTFPFLETESSETSSQVVEFLRNINWDLLAVPGNGNRYFVDIPAYVGRVYLDLNIDNSSPGLEFTGRLVDESFRVAGTVESSRGRVEYLDINFRVEKFGAEFNPFELYPTVYGRAYTTVRDSADAFPRDIYLVLYAIDPETGQEVAKGSWENFRFKLISSDPIVGETQEQVLAYLGYSVHNLQQKASSVGLTMTENFLIRPLVRPLERRLERELGLDYVRFRSNFTTNLFYLSLGAQTKFFQHGNLIQPRLAQNMDPMLLLLQSSEITLGKYLARNLYLSYSGQLVSLFDEAKIGFNHRFGVEYRLMKNLLLEVEYDRYLFNPIYYNRTALRDLRFRWRYSFNF